MNVGHAHLEDKYALKTAIGSGTFGTVALARPKRAGSQLVAVKTLKEVHACDPCHLREVQFYSAMPAHANLINLYEMFVDAGTGHVHFVMELMDFNMLELIKQRQGVPLSTTSVVAILSQLVRGLAHIHSNGYIHRDLKPENILLSRNSGRFQVKIADFGLARRYDPYSSHKWTSYVATRWYRAPEQLMGLPNHTYALDIWAFGVLAAELCNLMPIFPGRDSIDMITRQLRMLGTPREDGPGGSWDALGPLLKGSLTESLGHSRWFKEAPEVYERRNVFAVSARGKTGAEMMRFETLQPFSKVIFACLQWDARKRLSLPHVLEMVLKVPRGERPKRHYRSRST